MTIVADWGFPVLVVLMVGALLVVRARRRRDNGGMPVLIYRARGRARASRRTPVPVTWGVEREAESEGGSHRSGDPRGRPPRGPSPGAALDSHPHPPGETPAGPIASSGNIPEGTLQLLPGRLKVRGGHRDGEEIRFVRIPGAPAEVTFGRLTGPAYRHVQIQSLLVSRRHATLRFASGVWTLRNDSTTNPTVLNGSPLSPGTEAVELRHGDRIEMGDVSFVLDHQQARQPVAGLAGSRST